MIRNADNMLRRLWSLTAVALVSLSVAGCSDRSAENDTPATTDAGQSQGVKFAKCMRDNGVTGFPDPDASGRLTIDGVLNGSSLDPDSPAWEQAISACRDLQPSGFTGTGRSSEQQNAALEFAQCMRDNGIEDFPDPAADAPLIDTNRIPSAEGRGAKSIPGFQAAMDSCGDRAREAGVQK